MDKVVIITGPTAVGKTKCSLAIAEIFKTDIINGDAYQIYKHMNIGTAKPTLEELKRVKHHLIDFIEPTEEFNVATYQKMVRGLINEQIKCNKLPLIVGGTGLYLESVICNYEFKEENKDDKLEEEFKDYSNHDLYLYLDNLNHEAALNLHENNRKRVLRTIEKIRNNQSLDTKKDEMLYDALVIFLNDDRAALYERINHRVDEMMESGLLEEVRSLKKLNLSKTAKVAIGYKELFNYLDGNCTLVEAIDAIKQASRNYAKRQLTWFRNKPFVTFVDIDTVNFGQTIKTVEELIKNFLNQ